MHGIALLLTAAAIGVEYGWQPGDDGQLEYIIQIEPEMVKTLSQGEVDLLSDIPAELLPHIKRFRIRVGTGAVPRVGLEEAQAAAEAAKKQASPPAASRPPNQPGDGTAGGRRGPGSFKPTSNSTRAPNERTGNLLTPPGRVADEGDDITPVGQRPTGDRFGGNTSQPGARDQAEGQLYPDTNKPAPWRGSTGANTGGVAEAENTAGQNNGNFPDLNAPNRRPNTSAAEYPPGSRTSIPEIRRDTNQDPRDVGQDPRDPRAGAGNYQQPPPYGNPAWNQPQYATQPLRDPDQGYYPPRYDYPPPGYYPPYNQVAARPQTPPVAATPAPAASTPPAATPAPVTATSATKSSDAARERLADDPANRPWMPLTLTAMLLFASVGLNFYLGWIAHGVYQRYRALLMEVRNVRAAAI